MSSSPPPRPYALTYEDLLTTPDDGRRYEILDGELFVTPSPTTTHQRVSRDLHFVIHSHVTSCALGEVFAAPIDVILDRTTVVAPDLVFVARARASIISERAIEGAPDLVVEIASPGTAHIDRGLKQELYARYGVAHYWRVDAGARTLIELVLEGQSYVLRATHTHARPACCQLFPELGIDLGAVFPVAR